VYQLLIRRSLKAWEVIRTDMPKDLKLQREFFHRKPLEGVDDVDGIKEADFMGFRGGGGAVSFL
jgi:hypothetical protein